LTQGGRGGGSKNVKKINTYYLNGPLPNVIPKLNMN
jgi:hypothetical protein